MKITGRNIKRRLYGLRTLPSHLKRARHFRGHGVHSPYVYNIVRQVFMRSTFITDDRTLYDTLTAKGVAKRRALQLQNLMEHLRYESFSIDCAVAEIGKSNIAIVTIDQSPELFPALAAEARATGTTLCIIAPSFDRERDVMCKRLVEEHPCTSVDNRGYLLLFNNHLPKQIFRL